MPNQEPPRPYYIRPADVKAINIAREMLTLDEQLNRAFPDAITADKVYQRKQQLGHAEVVSVLHAKIDRAAVEVADAERERVHGLLNARRSTASIMVIDA
jgi:hypothetical protein